jgi:uncharacterized protein YutD
MQIIETITASKVNEKIHIKERAIETLNSYFELLNETREGMDEDEWYQYEGDVCEVLPKIILDIEDDLRFLRDWKSKN